MRLAWLVVSVTLLILQSGSDERKAELSKTFSESSDLITLRSEGLALYREGHYQEAAQVFSRGSEIALATDQRQSAAHFLFQMGSSRFRLLDYRRAMDAYMDAAPLAEESGDARLLTRLWTNVSSLYDHLGDFPAAQTAAERALGHSHPRFYRERAQSLVQLGTVHGNLGELGAAVRRIQQGILSAEQAQDGKILAHAWDQLGAVYLQSGQSALAQEAFEKGRTYNAGSAASREHLSAMYFGMVAQAEDRHQDAIRQFNLAEQVSLREKQPIPLRTIYTLRAESLAALAQWEASFEDFQNSTSWIRKLRGDILPADSVRIGMESSLTERSYSGAFNAAIQLYRQNPSKRFLHLAFQAAEENRAHSFRQSLRSAGQVRKALPDSYWPALAKLHATEVALLGEDSPANREQARLAQTALTELETKAGLRADTLAGNSADGDLLQAVQSALNRDEAYFSFHLAQGASWLWAVSRHSAAVYKLPPLADIQILAAEFRKAVQSGSPNLDQTGVELYRVLFGQLDPEFRDLPNWLLGLDSILFDIPLPALPVSSPSGQSYLIEKHALRIVPGAALIQTGGDRPLKGGFLGLGDPIYNRADARWTGNTSRAQAAQSPLRHALPWTAEASESKGSLQMARLPGSARELELCARSWNANGRSTETLLGGDVNGARLRQALQRNPGILHFATHFVASRQKPVSGLIALSLTDDGQPQFLGPAEIRMLYPSAQLVVLSGCSSGSADVLPGSGLLGLTRAWLLSGSDAVAASRWPTPDDSGEFFLSFYGSLARPLQTDTRRAAAVSLQRAQIQMIRSGTWRAAPRYWGAYFLVSRG